MFPVGSQIFVDVGNAASLTTGGCQNDCRSTLGSAKFEIVAFFGHFIKQKSDKSCGTNLASFE